MGITLINNESILYTMETNNEIQEKDLTANIYSRIATSLFGITGGEPPIKFNVTLTDKNLYLEAIGISAWGRLPESRYINKLSFSDIKSFTVYNINSKEFIELITNKDKKITLSRPIKNNDDIACKIRDIILDCINCD